MKEEKEIFKPKLRITTLSENGNPLSDRLVDACTEMYAGPKVQHKGPIRIEVTLVNQQDISQFKEYLDKLSGNLPIKESAGRGRPSNTQSKELESPREDILAGKINKVMIIGKGSQFLGRMTNLFDGVSFVIQANTGAEDNSGVSEEEVKGLIAKAMKDFAASLMATEE